MNRLSLILAGLFMPLKAWAYEIGAESVGILCGILSCSVGGGGAQGLSVYVMDRVVTASEIVIIAVAIIALFISAVQMVMFGNQEETVKTARTSYIYIITGLAIIGMARLAVIAFSAPETGAGLVNVSAAETGINNILTYFRLVIAVTLMVNIVLQATRLISSQGEDEQATKAKTRLIAGFVGAGLILVANALVVSIVPGTGGSNEIARQAAGIANYLVTILGFVSLLAIVVAGVLLMISVDETLKDKAKTIIKTAVVALIAVLVSYALVTAFIALG